MFRVLFLAWSCLPLRLAQWLGACGGRLAYHLSPGYRRRFDSFIKQAGLDTPPIRRAALAESGKTLAELPWLWTRSLAQTTALVQVSDWSLVTEAQQHGQGIIFLTPHLGCFEIAAQYYAAQAPITVLYSAPKHAAARRIVETARARHHLHTAPANLQGVKQLIRALRRCEAVGILPDQVPNHASEGEWSRYFGREAYTMTLPQRLQAITGARVILAFAERLPQARGYFLHLSALDTPVRTTSMNDALERLVRQCPEQYLWAYSRYKRPIGAS